VIFTHPTLLAEQAFLVLQHCVYPQGLSVLALNPRWIVMSLPELAEGELRLYQ
jgi:hypothetical protein